MPTVLVTGASRGLGLEFTRQYAAEGWQVLACARDPAGAAALLEASAAAPGRVTLHALDVADHASIDRLAAQLEDAAIDVLLNCAGTMGNGNFAAQGLAFGRFGGTDYADWERVLRINVLGPMKMAEAFVGQVARSEQRKIVTLTSILGSIARNTRGSLYGYRSSKAAVNAVMKSMAIDLAASHGIAATVIHQDDEIRNVGSSLRLKPIRHLKPHVVVLHIGEHLWVSFRDATEFSFPITVEHVNIEVRLGGVGSPDIGL